MIFRLLIVLSLNFWNVCSFGQAKNSVANDKLIFVDPIIYPSFPGGDVALREYIDKNKRWAQGQATVEGKVFVEFVVNIDGKIRNVKVARGLCKPCDKEAVRLVRNMPTWKPGVENGKKVKTKMMLPIAFGL